MSDYYRAGSTKYTNFISAGQLWNRVPDESYPGRVGGSTPEPPFPLDGLWREIALQFGIPQEILPTHLTFKEIKASDNKEIQLLSADNGIFISNNSGNTWITANYLGYGINDISSISDSGETAILFAASNAGWSYSNNSGQSFQNSPVDTSFNFIDGANTYYFLVDSYSMNYSGNTIYSIISSTPFDNLGNSGNPTFVGNRVAKTENYGNTWTVLTSFDSAVPTSKIVCSGDGNYIYSLNFDNNASLVVSRDGGTTASIEPLGDNAIPLSDVVCSQDGRIVVCTLEIIDGMQFVPELNNKLIYISRDYGVTWELVGVDNPQNMIYNTNTLFLYGYQHISMSRDGTRIVVLAKKQVINDPYVFFISLDTGVTWQEYSVKDIISTISNEEYPEIARVYITPDGNELIALIKGKFNYINPYIFSLSDKTWYFADYYVD